MLLKNLEVIKPEVGNMGWIKIKSKTGLKENLNKFKAKISTYNRFEVLSDSYDDQFELFPAYGVVENLDFQEGNTTKKQCRSEKRYPKTEKRKRNSKSLNKFETNDQLGKFGSSQYLFMNIVV